MLRNSFDDGKRTHATCTENVEFSFSINHSVEVVPDVDICLFLRCLCNDVHYRGTGISEYWKTPSQLRQSTIESFSFNVAWRLTSDHLYESMPPACVRSSIVPSSFPTLSHLISADSSAIVVLYPRKKAVDLLTLLVGAENEELKWAAAPPALELSYTSIPVNAQCLTQIASRCLFGNLRGKDR